jgi:hypothetical protein
MTEARVRFIVARMSVGQVLLFLALGAGLIWWGLETIYERPILAGVLFPVGVLFLFLGVGFVVREVRERRAHAQGPTQDEPSQRNSD